MFVVLVKTMYSTFYAHSFSETADIGRHQILSPDEYRVGFCF